MTILVTGSTGVIGRATIEQLVEVGEPVRALTRNPSGSQLPVEVEIVRGDLTVPTTLVSALAGVDRMFLLALPKTAKEVVALAKESGVRRIVTLSAGAVTYGMDTEFHLPVERAVEESGLEWTHVRPGEFAYNKVALWGPSIRAERVVRYPNPSRTQTCPVHERDVAAVATRALIDDVHVGRAYTFTGPGRITLLDQVEAIASAIGEDIRFEEVSAEHALRIAREYGGRTEATAEVMLGFMVLYSKPGMKADGQRASTDNRALCTIREILGEPARSFQEWAHDHTHDFC